MKRRLLPQVVKGRIEAGCDEAGRGCLAGPVVAAAVVLDPRVAQALPLNDSKQLTASQRQALRAEIEAKAITWSVAFVSPEEIDAMNILQASFEAMRRAVRGLAGEPDHLLIDGNRFVSASGYGWDTNMGYPTVSHRKALVELGPTPLHRATFKWAPPATTLFD